MLSKLEGVGPTVLSMSDENYTIMKKILENKDMIDAPEIFALPSGFQLHKNSMDRVEEVYDKYDEIEGEVPIGPEFRDGFIVHLQAKEDTYTEDGELHGFADSLIFQAIFFYPKRKKYFTTTGDSVDVASGLETSTRIFKDGSTLIWCRDPAKAKLYQAIEIQPLQ